MIAGYGCHGYGMYCVVFSVGYSQKLFLAGSNNVIVIHVVNIPHIFGDESK